MMQPAATTSGFIRWHLLAVWVGASLVAVAVCVGLYRREAQQTEQFIYEREGVRVTDAARRLVEDLSRVESLVGVLANGETLREFYADGRVEHLERWGREALDISRRQGDLDQIRYLDGNGMERVRVNFTNGIVPAAQLQDKSTRPYFREAITQRRNAVVVSAFDLNVENNYVEEPIKPVVRFSMPSFGTDGKVRGVVAINYFGQRLLDHLSGSDPASRKRMRLLNAQGYWLRGARAEDEWTFMFPERPQSTLARSAPELWQKMASNADGQARFDGGLFTWRRLESQPAIAGANKPPQFGDAFLTVASEVSRDDWDGAFRHLRQVFVLIGFVLVGVATAGVWLYHRQRTEQEQRRDADELNAAILRSAGTGVVTLSPDGMVRSINASAERLLGWTAAEVVGRQNAAIFYDRDDMKAFVISVSTEMGKRFKRGLEALAAKVAASDGPVEREWICVRKDGTHFPAWIANSAIRDVNGVATRYVGVFADITARKESEQLIRAARAAAEESTQMKARFLANMSHEIRTPMNGVVGMTSLLLDTDLTPEQRTLANTVRASADSLLTVINDILDFSKIEAGQLVFNPVPFDLRDPVENSLSLLAEKAQGKGLEIAYLIDENVPNQLVGDAGRLQQVLLNLAGNAIKFTERGEVLVSVSKVSDHDRRARLRFAVRDTGIGIEAKVQAKLFQPFVQADAGTSSKFGGTGLGLAISRQLVALMHGEIGIESTVGQGSTFWFTAEFPMQEAAPKTVVRRAELAGLRALIVDDNGTNREVLTRQLALWRVKSVAVATGEEALAALRSDAASESPFAFALLDMQLPGMSGLQLAEAIRADASFAAIKLIFLGSIGNSLSKRELDELGVAASLAKPVRQALLQETLERLVAQKESASPFPTKVTRAPFAPPTAELKLRILLAEDNPVNQQVARLQLLRFGYNADLVVDGEKAVEAVLAADYDIVLMDCQMPVLDGFEATRKIRALEEERRARGEQFTPLHIIAMTANAMVGDREACMAAGMNDYVSKPVRPADLAAAIAQAPAAHG